MELWLTISLVALCVLLEAFFSGSEIALITVSRHKLGVMLENHHKGALLLEKLFKSPSSLYGATSLGTNIFVVLGTVIMTDYFSRSSPDRADLYTILVMTPVTLFLGEIFPKVLFQRFSNKVTYIVIYPIAFFKKLFMPVLWITSGMAKLMLGQKSGEEHEHDFRSVSQEEIKRTFSMGEDNLDLHPQEMKMIHRIFDLRHTEVEQCMVPLVNVYAVREDDPISIARKKLHDSHVSRLPVYSERIHDIVGVVTAFDVLRYSNENSLVKDLMRPAFYVYRNRKVNDLLSDMQQTGVQMSIVVNEYSAAIGLATREDILEEIVGEIEDEYDTPTKMLEQKGSNCWRIEGGAEVDMINEELNLNIPVGEYETIAGYILSSLERIPAKGEKVPLGSLLFTIIDASHRGVTELELLKIKVKDDEKDKS